MSKSFLLSATASFLLFAGCSNSVDEPSSPDGFIKEFSQSINTEENTEEMYNPDQGFYKSIVFTVTDNGIIFPKDEDGKADWKKLKDLATYSTAKHNDKEYFIKSYDYYLEHRNDDWNTVARKTEFVQIYHLRFDISDLSKKINGDKDKEFPEQALTDLRFILETFKSLGANVIVRFAYCPRFAYKDDSPDYPNPNDFEASSTYIKKHVRSVCTVLKDYPDVLTAIEVGLVGPWGEMHSTTLAESDKEIIPDLVEEYLNGTINTRIPILVRTPDRIYAYAYKYLLNKDLSEIKSKRVKFADINNCSINPNSKAARIGLFNDGYLGSASDSGTFRSDDAPRSTQVTWLSANVTCRTPYGGEVINPVDNNHFKLSNTDDFNTVDEMFAMNLSYLNIGWNDKIVAYWHQTSYTGNDPSYQGKSEFTYIKNHFGYRFLVTSSTFSLSSSTSGRIKLQVKNIGFGNLLKTKKVSLLFVKNGNVVQKLTNVSDYHGQGELSFDYKLPSSLPENCMVYIRLDNGEGLYPIQFANKDMWNDELKANLIGSI